MRFYLENWREITQDQNILDIVEHCHIEFYDGINPVNSTCPRKYFSKAEGDAIDAEIQKLLEMKVIKEVEHHPNEFISPIFLVKKKNGEYRMILNLKELNESIVYHHFKMDTFESALKLIRPHCFMASIDIRHAYYSVFMAESDQVKLRFERSGKLYQYIVLPNGISCAPHYYTKLMKPIYASLRLLGHSNSGFIDDSLLVSDTESDCYRNIDDTVGLMTKVGFMIHPNKSVMVPTKKITFLGNDIDSEQMIVTLPSEKIKSIVQECSNIFRKNQICIRALARLIGLLVSSFSAVEYAPLHYRKLEKAKTSALKLSKGDFNANMIVTEEMKSELQWWIENLHSQKRHILHGNAEMLITTDASAAGWAAVCNGEEIGGRWLFLESHHHINYLELLAVHHSLKAFCKLKKNIHVQIKSDNSCTVAYINNMGGCKSEECNALAFEIWSWCIEHSIWLSATHVPGSENISDHGSRHFNDSVEWKLDSSIFKKLSELWGVPEIDMFASRCNKQVARYVSWKPDYEAEFIDAFSMDWSNIFMYIFCPFSLVARVCAKLRQDEAECIMIGPVWPTQNWWNRLTEMLIDYPRVIPVTQKTLTIPTVDKVHPLAGKLNLMACRLSGSLCKNAAFQVKLPKSLCPHGNIQLKSSTQFTLTNGFSSVVKDRVVQFILL